MHDFDRAIPAGSLPQHFRPIARRRSPTGGRSSSPIPTRVAAWRERLAEIGPGAVRRHLVAQPKVKTAERRLEYTRLDEWGELFAIPGVTWVNLQYDDCERELRDGRAASSA